MCTCIQTHTHVYAHTHTHIYIHRIEYCSAIKLKNEILTFATIRMDLENIILSEKVTQRKTDTINVCYLYVESKKQN